MHIISTTPNYTGNAPCIIKETSMALRFDRLQMSFGVCDVMRRRKQQCLDKREIHRIYLKLCFCWLLAEFLVRKEYAFQPAHFIVLFLFLISSFTSFSTLPFPSQFSFILPLLLVSLFFLISSLFAKSPFPYLLFHLFLYFLLFSPPTFPPFYFIFPSTYFFTFFSSSFPRSSSSSSFFLFLLQIHNFSLSPPSFAFASSFFSFSSFHSVILPFPHSFLPADSQSTTTDKVDI